MQVIMHISLTPGTARMYNQLAGDRAGKEEDYCAWVHLKLAELKYT